MHKIVFVEDDPEVGKLIAAYLGKHDIDVLIEPRGDSAQARIELEQPDLVLLDIMLPCCWRGCVCTFTSSASRKKSRFRR